jgi:hypothetical protein
MWRPHLQNLLVTIPFGGSTITITNTTADSITDGCINFSKSILHNDHS